MDKEQNGNQEISLTYSASAYNYTIGKPFFSYIPLIDTNCVFKFEGLQKSHDAPLLDFYVLLYDINNMESEPVDKPGIVCFDSCDILAQSDSSLSSPPLWGDFPYGIWRTRISLNGDDRDTFSENGLILEIKLPKLSDGNPLDAMYFIQKKDILTQKIYWEEIPLNVFYEESEEDLNDYYNYFINISGKTLSLNIRLHDLVSKENQMDEIGTHLMDTNQRIGKVDIDPYQWSIEHIGGLMWLTPGKGRCFIDCTVR